MSEDDVVEIEGVEVIAETSDAILVMLSEGDEVWFPKSCVSEDSEVWQKGDSGTVLVARWMAEKKGLG